MNLDLFQALIAKNLIKPGTELTILRRGNDVGGNAVYVEDIFEADEVLKNGEDVSIRAHGTSDGKISIITHKNIKRVDGMVPSRLGRVYGIKENGIKEKAKKKRGRKPKIRVAEPTE